MIVLKIGIDLDGVIFDSERIFRVYAELYDILELHQNGIIDNREVRFQERYNWSQEIINNFMLKYHTKIIGEAAFMPGSKEVITVVKAFLNVLVRNIRYSEKHISELNFNVSYFSVELLDAVRELLHLLEEFRNILSLFLELRHLT